MYEHLKKEYYDNEYYDYDKYDKYYKYGKKNIEDILNEYCDLWETSAMVPSLPSLTSTKSLEKTNEETLEGIPIAEIEKFLRKKKLEKLGNK